jgi:sugar phosphate isomerase/epimerase
LRTGISSYAFRWAIGTPGFTPSQPLTPHTLLEKAAWLGAEVVQICENLPLDRLDEPGLRALGRQAESLGISLEVGTVGFEHEHLARYVEIARLVGARVLRVTEAQEGALATLEGTAAELRRALPACRAAGVTIAIENDFRLSSGQLAALVQAVDDPHMGICLDTANSIAGLEGWREVMRNLAPYAASLHAKDVAAEKQGTGFAIRGRPLGQGLVDLPAVLEAVWAAGRDPNVLAEFWLDPLAAEEATLRREEAWIAESLAYLRAICAGRAVL